MTSNALIITADTLQSLPQSVQDAVLAAVFGTTAKSGGGTGDEMLSVDDDNLAQLSPAQARDFYAGCGDKTRKALEVIAKSDSRMFQVADIAAAIGVEASELRGVWGGLTRRLYTITGDSSGYLIKWEGHPPIFDENDDYIDQVGEVSELTYRSFRKLLVK